MTKEPSFQWWPGGGFCLGTSIALLLSVALVSTGRVNAQSATNAAPLTNTLSMAQFLKLVLERNESVQLRVLELEITQRRFNAEQGVFEPDFFIAASREENKRENTAEQRRSLRLNVFEEKNNVYRSGLEGLVPSGAKIRLGYTMRDLNNNIQDPRSAIGTIATNRGKIDEFQSFAGLSITQPILKNFGLNATLANVRLAAIASDIAYQEYRRQLMETIATAEAAYWNLFMAQEQVRFFRESTALAESIVRDNRVRAETGKGSDLEVLEAEAGLALRRTKLAEAEQKRYEAEMHVLTLYSGSGLSPHPTVVAVDRPAIESALPAFLESAEEAFDLNPDYQAQQKKIKQEDIRLAYARNQRLPQLDLSASYGLNGLGETPGASHDDLQRRGFPSFSVGFELHVPLAGDIKARNELAAAKLRKEQALLSLKQVETQIINAVQAAVQKIRSARDAVENNQKVVAFHENLLKTDLERLEVGRVESRKVLEVEAALFESRNAAMDAMVQYERARLELQLVQGAILKSRHIEFSQEQFQDRTAMLLAQRQHTGAEFQELMRALYAEPPTPREAPPESDELKKARRILREKLHELQIESEKPVPPPSENGLPPATPEQLENARRMLRQKTEALQTAPPKSE